MNNDEQSQTNGSIERFEISAEKAVDMFADAGVPRSLSTINRFCRDGNLVCRKLPVNQTSKYFITHKSIERMVAELQQMSSLQEAVAVDDQPSLPVANDDEPPLAVSNDEQSRTFTRERDEERAEERGSLKTEVARLKERLREEEIKNVRLESEMAGIRTALPQLQGLADRYENLVNQRAGLIEANKRLTTEREDLQNHVRMLEAPKEDKPKGFWARLVG